MVVAAVGAVVILIAASVARCAAVRGSGAGGSEPTQTDDAVTTEDPATSETTTALARLASCEWMSPDDAAKRMTLADGRLVETDGTSTYICSYGVVSDGPAQAELDVLRADGTHVTADVTVTGAGDAMRVSSDAFQVSQSWVPVPSGDSEVEVAGVDEAYLDLVGGDEAGLDAAVVGWCSAHAVAATRATFDGEVYLDTKTGDVTATLTCDDPGETILSVTWASGTFKVVG